MKIHRLSMSLIKGAFVQTLIITTGCSTPPKVLSVRSQPAEAEVCIKGRAGSEIFTAEKQCVGMTPFEADKVEIIDSNGKKKLVHFNQLNKESFYLVLNRKGYSSESSLVPGWEHFMVLKPEAPMLPSASAELPIPVKTGTVNITSEPVGALVYINDTLRGNTPFAFEGQTGMAKVKLEYPDRVNYEGIMTVTSGESRELNIRLLPKMKENQALAKGSVRIDSIPAGALLYVDGALKGNAPYLYEGDPAQSIHVKLELSGYKTIEKTVKLSEAGKELNLSLQMSPSEAHASAAEHASTNPDNH